MKFPQIAATPFSGPLTRLTQTLVCCLRRARSASRSKPSPRAVPGRGRSAEAVDESETGSANFFGPTRSVRPRSGPVEGSGETGRFPQLGSTTSLVQSPLFKLHDSLIRCWKKKKSQFATSTFSDPLDARSLRVSVLLAPSTEREQDEAGSE